jgi:hypothetical protein
MVWKAIATVDHAGATHSLLRWRTSSAQAEADLTHGWQPDSDFTGASWSAACTVCVCCLLQSDQHEEAMRHGDALKKLANLRAFSKSINSIHKDILQRSKNATMSNSKAV